MSLGGLLSLKWNNHCSTFLHILSTLHRKQSYDDATVACDGKLYPVHKLVLSTCSEYFEEMFEKTHGKHPVIVLKDIKKEVFEALLKYMYIGEVNVVQEKLAELINAAECLKIKGLAVPDEEPEPQNHSSTSNKNKTGGHASLPSSLPLGEKDSTYQSSVRNARVSATNNQSTKRKESQSFHNNNVPPRKIIRASNEAFRNATPSEANVNEDHGANSGAFGSTARAPKSIETRENRSSLDERTSTSSSLTNHEEDDIAVWPATVKEEPVDHHVPDEANTESVAAPELGDDGAVSANHSNNDNSDNDGGGGHDNNGGGEHDVGDDDGAHPASSTPQSEEKNEECPGEAASDHHEMMDSKVEVAEVEESSDDWEGVLADKGDGDDAEALSNMLSGDDASNTPADDRTSGVWTGHQSELERCAASLGRRNNPLDELGSFAQRPLPIQHPSFVRQRGRMSSAHRPNESNSFMSSSPTGKYTDELHLGYDSQSFVGSPTANAWECGVPAMDWDSSEVFGGKELASVPSGRWVTPGQSGPSSSVPYSDRRYPCPHCPYRATVKGNLSMHLRTHTGEKPFKCTMCSYSSAFQQNLQRHVKTTHCIAPVPSQGGLT